MNRFRNSGQKIKLNNNQKTINYATGYRGKDSILKRC